MQLCPNYSYTRCSDTHTHTHAHTHTWTHPCRHTLIACLAKSSYLHATVALLTTEDTLASFSKLRPPSRPLPAPPSTTTLLRLFSSLIFLCCSSCWIAGSVALFRRGRAVYKTKTTPEIDCTNLFSFAPSCLPYWKYSRFFIPICPPILCPCSVCLYLHVCVCVCVQTQHRAQRPAVTSDSFTLCPLSTLTREVLCLKGLCYASSPLPHTHTDPLWFLTDHNNVNTHKSIIWFIKRCRPQKLFSI